MKKIIISLGVIGAVAAVVVGGTMAYFNDTETSTGNIFTAGSIDLKVDHTLATYNGQACVGDCAETGSELILNGGFETPVVTDNGGQYQIYPSGISGWAVESGALELQRNGVAGAPHGGVQLTELDSTQSSSISQTIATVPGGKYRLHFWYSPRPNNAANDNNIGFTVKVVSNSSVIINDTVGGGAAGSGNTVWTEHIYDFIAVDGSTKIVFSDAGTINNMLGGYIDDVSMFALNCTETGFPYGGQCHLWNEKDLGDSDQFWNFPDVKPGDHGTNVISLHVDSNDAFVCLLNNSVQNIENGVVEAEGADTEPTGELSGYMDLFIWNDENGNGIYEPAGEASLYEDGFNPVAMTRLSLPAGGNDNLGVAWCVGNQSVSHTTGAISCDGTGNQDNAQTDKVVADIVLYAVQQRNNAGFTCASLNLPQLVY
ncbi:MAG: TasA family protein [Patescibacteria group bacterium]|jgi:predicted ribosomally synthesized peptide with SipW-like signal peptide